MFLNSSTDVTVTERNASELSSSTTHNLEKVPANNKFFRSKVPFLPSEGVQQKANLFACIIFSVSSIPNS